MSPSAYTASPELTAEIDRLGQRALVAGVAGLALCAAGYFVDPDHLFRSYLAAFVFWNGVALGALAICMLHHLSGGGWGMVIRRILEAAARTFPVNLFLFLPITLGIHRLYSWSRPEILAADETLRKKAAYLNVPFFLGRTALYFAIWITVSHLLNKWSLQQDRTGPEPAQTRMQLLSGPGLLLWGATVTFSSIDWMMSLDPHWASTIFGMLFMGGQGVGALAFLLCAIAALIRFQPLASAIGSKHLHDLGKLLFAFIMLWAYFGFSQYLLIWSANLPEEIYWYLKRLQGGWQYVALLIVLLHFVLPFALLLSAEKKTSHRFLAWIGGLMIVMRLVDLNWIAAPNFAPTASLHWLDLAAPIGIGGVWVAAFLWQLKQRPLLPVQDPMLEEALTHGRK